MWSYNSFYDDPNNVLMHSSHKYIDREWKNGRWQYTYDEKSGGVRRRESSASKTNVAYQKDVNSLGLNLKARNKVLNGSVRKGSRDTSLDFNRRRFRDFHRMSAKNNNLFNELKPYLSEIKDKYFSDEKTQKQNAKAAEKEHSDKTRADAMNKIGKILNEHHKSTLDPERRNAQSSREAAIQDAAKRTQEKNRLDAREKADNTLDAATIKNNFQNEIKRQLARARNRDEALKIMNELGEKYGFNAISKKEYEELSKKDKVKLDTFEDMYSEIFWEESVSPMASDYDLYFNKKRNKDTLRYGKL